MCSNKENWTDNDERIDMIKDTGWILMTIDDD